VRQEFVLPSDGSPWLLGDPSYMDDLPDELPDDGPVLYEEVLLLGRPDASAGSVHVTLVWDEPMAAADLTLVPLWAGRLTLYDDDLTLMSGNMDELLSLNCGEAVDLRVYVDSPVRPSRLLVVLEWVDSTGGWTGTVDYQVPFARHLGPWRSDDTELWRAMGRPPLFLPVGSPAEMPSLDFLLELDGLPGLSLLGAVRDDSVVQRLSDLRYLYLDTADERPLDLSRSASSLTMLYLDAHRVTGDFSQFTRLEDYVGAWNRPDVSELAAVTTLERVTLYGSKLKSIGALAALPRLENLKIRFSRVLETIEPLPNPRLTEVEITGCRKLRDLSGLAVAPSLRDLELDNCPRLETLAPLAQSRSLSALGLVGSTATADGRLAFLTELPQLTRLGVERLKPFDMTRAELDAFISRPQTSPL
jgi:hypothetical protein